MSIKNLFEEKSKIVAKTTVKDLTESLESEDYIFVRDKKIKRFLPTVDYSKPENFARYGLAERYYTDSIERIYQTYPYDGTFYEKEAWHLSSSYLDNHIFRVDYPRTNGFALFSPSGWGTQSANHDNYGLPSTAEYVYIKGGPHADPYGDIKGENSLANIYDSASYRESNLKIDGATGNTVEFWLKKDGYDTSKTRLEVLFDATVSGSTPGDADYGRLRVTIDNNPASSAFLITYQSGSLGFIDTAIGGSSITEDTIADGKWHHYAFTFKHNPTTEKIDSNLYIDGAYNATVSVAAATFGAIDGNIVANIAALVDSPTAASSAGLGYGKLSGSMDEFRFWKVERNAKEIGENWLTNVGGGTNKYEHNTKLGVYYKFNEGITTDATTDSVALDYSGRVSNGSWVGYSSSSRNTGSAMVDSGNALREFQDPIIYSNHPDVVSLLDEKRQLGQSHDYQNTSALYYSLPTWIIEEQMNTHTEDKSTLSDMMQIMASYFDTLHLQIEAITSLKDVSYRDYPSPTHVSGSDFAPFTEKLLESSGFIAPDLFADAEVLEKFGTRNKDGQFEFELHQVKNFIYRNIYNNLTNIYKSKGTEKSFRNLFRCFGIDEELIKLNVYADNHTYSFSDTFLHKSHKQKVVDFNSPDRYGATIFQSGSLNPYRAHYISGSGTTGETDVSTTVEADIFFPRKERYGSKYFQETGFITSSLFGIHTPSTIAGDMTWASNDFASIQAHVVRTSEYESDAYFMLTSSAGIIPELTSPIVHDVYGDNKWNISFRVKPAPHMAASPSGSMDGSVAAQAAAFVVEFRGTRYILDSLEDSFHVTGAVSRTNATRLCFAPKTLYAGAHRVNYTGSVSEYSDVKISNIRYWNAYLSNDELDFHSKNPDNFGRMHPSKPEYVNKSDILDSNYRETDTLALHWDFDRVTTSDSSGEFVVVDASSGSVGALSTFDGMTKRHHVGVGYGFPTSSTSVVSTMWTAGLQQALPENVYSSDMVKALDSDSEVFRYDSRPINYFFSFEKSMYQTISAEMLKFFATIKDFNNLIGEPVNKYRQSYKGMQKLKEMFFRRVDNTPDIEKYVEYYKWFDSALSVMIDQLKPATTRFSEDIRTMIESHVLERNKYWTKFPTIEMKSVDPIAQLRGGAAEHRGFHWGRDHAPLPSSPRKESENCSWWANMAERTTTEIFRDAHISDEVREAREAIRRIKITKVSGSSYYTRALSHPYVLDMKRDRVIGSMEENRILNLYAMALRPGTTSGLSIAASSVQEFLDCDDSTPTTKRRIRAEAVYLGDNSYTDTGTDLALPFRFYSSSIGDGYISGLTTFKAGVSITNIHHDSYNNEIIAPLQGVYTSQHVGGNANRHVKAGETDPQLRPETYKLQISSGQIVLVHQGFETPRTFCAREGLAKRPVNIRNIQTTTSSAHVGNYQYDYDIVFTGGRASNNRDFIKNSGYADSTYSPVSSEFFDDFVDLPKIQRERTNHVLVNRFSSPGGPETAGDADGGQGLDRETSEFSIYNSMNYRNSIVRSDLDTLYAEHSNQFGARSGSVHISNTYEFMSGSGAGYASVHMTNRNSAARKESVGTVNFNTKAVLLDGSTEYLRLDAARAIFTDNNEISLFAWIKHPTVSNANAHVIFSIHDSSGGNRHLFLLRGTAGTDGTLQFYQNSTGWQKVSNTRIDDDKWHLVGFVYEGTGNTLKLYLDGESQGDALTVTNIASIMAGTDLVSIGQEWDAGPTASDFFDGHIADLAIWNKSLTQAQIREIYSDGFFKGPHDLLKHTANANLQAWYRMGDGDNGSGTPDSAGGTIFDMSANSYNATPVSGPTIVSVPSLPGETHVIEDRLERDNFFVQRPIPRNELQYSWVTASSIETTSSFPGYVHEFSIPSGNTDSVYQDEIRFLTASENNANNDFVGLNRIINRALTSSTNTIGNSLSTTEGSVNDILLNRQGPYGWPSWKQMRGSEHPIARLHRRNNIISIQSRDGTPNQRTMNIYDWPQKIPENVSSTKDREINNFYDTPVSAKYKPVEIGFGNLKGQILGTLQEEMVDNVDLMTITPDENTRIFHRGERNVVAKVSYGNAATSFANSEIIKLLSIEECKEGIYQNAHDIMVDNGIIPNSIVYSEVVYPREDNTFTKKARTRVNFNNDFWRDSHADRVEELTYESGKTNSFGIYRRTSKAYYISASMWPLDARTDFSKVPPTIEQGGALNYNNFHDQLGVSGSGELQNDYSLFHSAMEGASHHKLQMAPLYNRLIPQEYDNKEYLAGHSKWETGEQSGKTPFYDSYENYREELRAVGKEYSLVPEFRMSEHMESIVLTGSSFSAPLESFLTLTGSSVANSSFSAFFETYSNTDFLKYFQVVRDMSSEDMGKEPSKIWLKCNALLKFLPYDGFYPALRTLQMAKMWNDDYTRGNLSGNSYTKYRIEINRNHAAKPLFAPGILFNSIKSGVAVDYPIFKNPGTGSVRDEENLLGVGYRSITKNTVAEAIAAGGTQGSIQGRFHHTASFNVRHGRYGQGVTGSWANGTADESIPRLSSSTCVRVPFEAILSPDTMRGTILYDNEPHPSASMIVPFLHHSAYGVAKYYDLHPIYGSVLTGSEDTEDLYESFIYRTLTDIAHKNGLTLKVQNADLYSMAANNFFAESINFFLKDSSVKSFISEPDTYNFTVGRTYAMRITLANENVVMYENRAAFGPPVDNSSPDKGTSHGFAPYCPAFQRYDDEAYVDLSFTATKSSYTVEELFAVLAPSYSENSRQTGSAYQLLTGSSTNQEYQMRISSSVNLFGTIEDLDVEYDANGNVRTARRGASNKRKRWVIQPKWECPILDFSDKSMTVLNLNSGQTETQTTTGFFENASNNEYLMSSRGMWHQYGTVPGESRGIFLGISDITGSESLAAAVGFPRGNRQRLGELPEDGERVISEAVVAIPYYVKRSKANFFKLDRQQVKNVLNNTNLESVDNSIKHQIEMMNRYVFPPQMDFVNNRRKTPIAMYVFEFSHKLSRKDVSDIWQNLPPDIGTHGIGSRPGDPFGMGSTEVTVGHSLKSPDADIKDPLGGVLPDKLRWMVFKVKRRASANYFKKLSDSLTGHKHGGISIFNESEKRQLVSSTLDDLQKRAKYSYNWPYDFFSLVELIKVTAEVEIE